MERKVYFSFVLCSRQFSVRAGHGKNIYERKTGNLGRGTWTSSPSSLRFSHSYQGGFRSCHWRGIIIRKSSIFSKMTPGNETLPHCLHFRFRRPPQGDYRWIFVGFLSGEGDCALGNKAFVRWLLIFWGGNDALSLRLIPSSSIQRLCQGWGGRISGKKAEKKVPELNRHSHRLFSFLCFIERNPGTVCIPFSIKVRQLQFVPFSRHIFVFLGFFYAKTYARRRRGEKVICHHILISHTKSSTIFHPS